MLGQVDQVAGMFRKSRSATMVTIVEAGLPPLLKLKAVADCSSPADMERNISALLADQAWEVTREAERLSATARTRGPVPKRGRRR